MSDTDTQELGWTAKSAYLEAACDGVLYRITNANDGATCLIVRSHPNTVVFRHASVEDAKAFAELFSDAFDAFD